MADHTNEDGGKPAAPTSTRAVDEDVVARRLEAAIARAAASRSARPSQGSASAVGVGAGTVAGEQPLLPPTAATPSPPRTHPGPPTPPPPSTTGTDPVSTWWNNLRTEVGAKHRELFPDSVAYKPVATPKPPAAAGQPPAASPVTAQRPPSGAPVAAAPVSPSAPNGSMFDAVINGGPLDPVHRGFLGLRTMFLALPLFPILALVEGRTAAANAVGKLPVSNFVAATMRGVQLWVPFTAFTTLFYGLHVPLWHLRAATRTQVGLGPPVAAAGPPAAPAPTGEADFDLGLRCASGVTAAVVAAGPLWARGGPRVVMPMVVAGGVCGCFMPALSKLQALRGQGVL